MGNKVITIGREYGSGGHKVGQLLAEKLGIPYYDNELIYLAAQKGGIDQQRFAPHDEKKYNPMLFEVNYSGNENVVQGLSMSETLFDLQSKVIKDIAATTDAVIVGRCADSVLKDSDATVISVFIGAPFEARVARTMNIEGFGEKETQAITKKKDKKRKTYYEHYAKKTWADPASYDLYFDSSKEDLNTIAEKIVEVYQSK
ncbi:MAG: cytidylate kinase-like family protein [Lachnospira sp.]|nr:cytidylate kinase-like family protein [Lachnospira sp.]